tara:strand:- start:14 stop:355 length:342 start_codon:yes stop_codon:yes gene_type:complete
MDFGDVIMKEKIDFMKEKKIEHLEIVGLIDNPVWKKMPCKCSPDQPMLQFPFIDCLRCKCQTQQDSMPRKPFKISHEELDKNKNPTGKRITKTIKKITIVRGDKFQEIRGWVF